MAEVARDIAGDRPVLTLDEVRALSRRLGESLPMARHREHGLAAYREHPLPDRVQHLWRYTDPTWLLPVDGGIAESSAWSAVGDAGTGVAADVVVRPGRPEILGDEDTLRASGVELVPLALSGPYGSLLGNTVAAEHGLFEAYNTAAWNGGALLRVRAGARPERPIHIRVEASASTSVPRLLVLVERGAEAVVVEEHVGGDAGTHVVGVSELLVDDGARLRHVLLQRWSDGVRGHLTQRARLAREATMQTVVVSLGGARLKLDLGTVLAGDGGHSEILGMTLGEGRQHMDLHTVHEHLGRHTGSNLDIKVALNGRARSVYTGLIRIDEQAAQSEAYQENRNLLLSRRAKADTIPELEILHNDVQCSHGATVSPVDDEPLFYLRSRGIDGDEALQLVVRGFFEPVLARIPDTLRDGVAAAVDERIGRLRGGGR